MGVDATDRTSHGNTKETDISNENVDEVPFASKTN